MSILKTIGLPDAPLALTEAIEPLRTQGWAQNEVPLFVPLFQLIELYLIGRCGFTGSTAMHPCNSHNRLNAPIGKATDTGQPEDFTFHARPLSGYIDTRMPENPVPAGADPLDGLVGTLFADAGGHLHTGEKYLSMHYATASYVFDVNRNGVSDLRNRVAWDTPPAFVGELTTAGGAPFYIYQLEGDESRNFNAYHNSCTTSAQDQTRFAMVSSPDSLSSSISEDRAYRYMHVCAWPTRRLSSDERTGPIAFGELEGRPIRQTQSYLNPDYYHTVISEAYSDDGSAVENGLGFFGMSTADLRPCATPTYEGIDSDRNFRKETLLHPSSRDFAYTQTPDTAMTYSANNSRVYDMNLHNTCHHASMRSTTGRTVGEGDEGIMMYRPHRMVLPTLAGSTCSTIAVVNPNRPYVVDTAATSTEDIGKVCKYTHFAFTRIF